MQITNSRHIHDRWLTFTPHPTSHDAPPRATRHHPPEGPMGNATRLSVHGQPTQRQRTPNAPVSIRWHLARRPRSNVTMNMRILCIARIGQAAVSVNGDVLLLLLLPQHIIVRHESSQPPMQAANTSSQ
ncbi:unnamed protein product, partial [Mesorhabditis spiculigera]